MKFNSIFVLKFIICFYRFIGITFGGITLTQDGTLIKSKFWCFYGYFGCCYHIALIVILTTNIFLNESFDILMSPRLFIVKLMIINWQILRCVIILSTSILLNGKYSYKIIEIIVKYSLTQFDKLKFIAIIWFIQFISSIVIFSIAFFTKINLLNFFLTFNHDIIFIPLMHSTSFI